MKINLACKVPYYLLFLNPVELSLVRENTSCILFKWLGGGDFSPDIMKLMFENLEKLCLLKISLTNILHFFEFYSCSGFYLL